MLWSELDFWQTGEWQAIDECLKDLTKDGVKWNPGRKNLFRALDAVPFDSVKCVLVGQDPYPESQMATGLAFSIPPGLKRVPVTIANFARELDDDVHVTTNGDLSEWPQEGVLLWNVIPSCIAGKSLSHVPEKGWRWDMLTMEIFQKLSSRGIVFALLGKYATRYRGYIDESESEVLITTHPSPRANTKMPPGKLRTAACFSGSRLFSTINVKLVELGHEPIDWRTNISVPESPLVSV